LPAETLHAEPAGGPGEGNNDRVLTRTPPASLRPNVASRRLQPCFHREKCLLPRLRAAAFAVPMRFPFGRHTPC
ncbi:hypothetical protein CEE87_12630, partial [Lactobacillus crispatus]